MENKIVLKKQINAANISLIIYDFDGVMTDNKVLVFENGREAVSVNRSDGLAVNIIAKMRITQIIISSEPNGVVRARARKLNIPYINSVNDKKKTVIKYLNKCNISRKRVVFIGNDINDEEAMKFVGYPIAPADAHRQIKKIAKIVLSVNGGNGVVREFLDILRGY